MDFLTLHVVLELALSQIVSSPHVVVFWGGFFLNALVFGAVGTATGKWNEVT